MMIEKKLTGHYMLDMIGIWLSFDRYEKTKNALYLSAIHIGAVFALFF
jgi:hypothetical protein